MRTFSKKEISISIVVFLIAAYVIWSFAHTKAPLPGVVVTPPPAVTAPKVPGPVLKKPLQIVPPAAVQKKFPQLGPIAPDKPVIDTAKIPNAENGGATITFMNVSTGTAETKFIPNSAPWFALEDRNTIGAGYETSTEGARVPVYYRRDILRVKDVHLLAEVGGKFPIGPGKIEGHAGIFGELRF